MSMITCSYCNMSCKSKGGLTHHLRYCKVKNDGDINVASSKSSHKKQNYTSNKDLHPFNKDIDWSNSDLSENFFIECCVRRDKGIVDLFEELHKHPNHYNIKYSNNKLLVFDGNGWVRLQENMLRDHLGFLYSALEEKWCDYLMDIRCGNVNRPYVSCDDIAEVERFLYDTIVDDDSVLFYCKDLLYDSIEELKK